VRQADPFVGQLVAVQDVQGLVDTDQIGNPRDAIDLQHPLRILLPLIEGAAGQTAQQFARFLVAQLPGRRQTEKSLQRRAGQAFAFRLRSQIDGGGRLEAAFGIGVGGSHDLLLLWIYYTPFQENQACPVNPAPSASRALHRRYIRAASRKAMAADNAPSSAMTAA